MSIRLFILVLACVLLLLAACKTPEPPRVSFGWAGVFLIAAITLLVTGCASPPKISADQLPDGSALCWTNTGVGGTQTLTYAKLDKGTVRNGGITVKPSCETAITSEQTVKPEPAK